MLPLSDSFMGLSMNINIKTKVYSELDIYIWIYKEKMKREGSNSWLQDLGWIEWSRWRCLLVLGLVDDGDDMVIMKCI